MTTTVFDNLNQEWAQLTLTARAAGRIDDCIRRWPELSTISHEPPATVLQQLAPGVESDILLELLRQFDGGRGDYVAGRLVLQCMIPATIRLARLYAASYRLISDCHADAVACMWRAIAEYDLDREHGEIFFALRSRARNLIAAEVRRARARDFPLDPHDMDLVDPSASNRSPGVYDVTDPILGLTGEVLELIAQGVDCTAITGAEAALLTRIYAPDADDALNPQLQASLAREMGISHAALRARASRAVRRLAEGVQTGAWGTNSPCPD